MVKLSKLIPIHQNTMKNILVSGFAGILAFAILTSKVNGLEETPEAIPLSSYPQAPTYQFWDEFLHPIQIHTRSLPSSEFRPDYSATTMHRPWYSSFYMNKKSDYVNKKNDDIARLAMRILKKRSSQW